ncbi:MAG TPA: hypothetical protein EYP55_10065 [Anaerolineae bacterium]|nr:hypothetical protein [Anaerolineae bacterium]
MIQRFWRFLKDKEGPELVEWAVASVMIGALLIAVIMIVQNLEAILGWAKTSRDAPIIALWTGILIFVLIMTGPTLWRDWQEERSKRQQEP